MKLTLEKIRWKNLLSYGAMWTEIDLNRNPVTILTGKNGFGKSTITEAISYCLYGKSIRKTKKANLVNRRNKKDCLIEIYFKVDNTSYLVRRGIKPDIFEIYKDGELQNQDAANKDYQAILENNILKTNFVTFTQSVIVSKTLYTPFMQLGTPKRREFIENILKLQIFTTMSKLHKEKLDKLKDDHDTTKYDYEKLSIRHDETDKMIGITRTLIESNTNEKVNGINNNIIDKKNTISNHIKEYKDYESKLINVNDDIVKKYNNNKALLVKLNAKKETLEDNYNKINDSDICTQCGSEYKEDHFKKHKEEISNNIRKVNETIENLTLLDNSYIIDYVQYEKDIKFNNEINSNILGIKRILVSLTNDVKALEKELREIKVDTTELDKLIDMLYNISIDKNKKELEYKELAKHLTYSTKITSLLKDNGIKSTIIEKSIPLINSLINKNLNDFGFFVSFELDKDFNEIITSRGFNASYNDFSEGEKLRIDMAILLAWRELSMIKSAMFCNVLFLDEITDASMDDEGTEIFAKMLTQLKDNNVFVITHKPEKLDNIARSTIQIEKKDGYSRII